MSYATAYDASDVSLDEYGVLRCGDKWTALPKVEQTVMEMLLSKFGSVVPGAALIGALWPGREFDPTYRPLNVVVFRLRKRIAPIGLAISTVRSQGFLLHWAEPV